MDNSAHIYLSTLQCRYNSWVRKGATGVVDRALGVGNKDRKGAWLAIGATKMQEPTWRLCHNELCMAHSYYCHAFGSR